MPNPKLAARILNQIQARPHQHDQSAWMGGALSLSPDADLTAPAHCGTTLCVAGYAAHFTGHTLQADVRSASGTTVAYKVEGEALKVSEVAQAELGLSTDDADVLFDPGTTQIEVLAALEQLADGATSIDWPAVGALALTTS
ncbi:hypothetical protein ACFYY1_39225 [Streptomyces sp. NPDC001890]|uniref:hypothetical protein n=1 Tax=Streptomyces sp. NPDC001890 TaxID=3364620 RepID=UPI0036C6AA08